MRRVIDEAGIWPPNNSVGRRRRRTTRTKRLLRLLRRALPSPDPLDWGALADAASREIAVQTKEKRPRGAIAGSLLTLLDGNPLMRGRSGLHSHQQLNKSHIPRVVPSGRAGGNGIGSPRERDGPPHPPAIPEVRLRAPAAYHAGLRVSGRLGKLMAEQPKNPGAGHLAGSQVPHQ